MKTLTYIILIALLNGCTASKLYFPLNPKNETEAIVQFMRPNIVPTAFAIQIFVDGKKAAVLSNKSYISFSIPAGEHEILLDWPPGSLGVGYIKQKYVFSGGEHRHFLLNDKSKIRGETLVNNKRLYLTELSSEDSQRLVGQFK